MKRLIYLFGGLLIFPLISSAQLSPEAFYSSHISDYKGWGIAIEAGTLGPGAEIVKSFNKTFSLRTGHSYFTYNFDYEPNDDLNADIDLELGTVPILADIYLGNFFHITGGVLINTTEVSAKGTPTQAISINDITIDPENVGSLNMKFSPPSTNVYMAIGFGRSRPINHRMGFNFELGAVYMGELDVEMEGTGMLAPSANAEQQQLLEDNLSDYQFYPQLLFQLTFRLN